MKRLYLAVLSLLLFPLSIHAQPAARFDLTGPKIDVHVTRGGVTLPIAEVPNLQPGDRIWLHPDLPPTQSVHLLLIATFLRGTTNPPPDSWFTRIQTWDKKVREEGVTIIVPDEAQTAILFVAPETGGDFSTLKSAVRGRPGTFVRASATLNEASFEQSRIERYAEAIRRIQGNDPKSIADHSAKLAATLNLKPNADCFKQPAEQQQSCLTQSGQQSLLDDGHGQTVASVLANGPSSDFINAASYTGVAGAGVYSAYVGAVVDLVRLMSGLHTAQYQYIPAIAFPEEQTLNLKLNAAPSFNNPKSVIVIGMPAIQKAALPPLKLTDPEHVACTLQPKMVLPLDGAPLVYATGFAHNITLRVKSGADFTELPLQPDAFEGGLIVAQERARKSLNEASSAKPAAPSPQAPKDILTTATLHGFWGFDTFDGPTVAVQQLPGGNWTVARDTQVYAGTENHLTLQSTGTACVESIHVDGEKGAAGVVTYKPVAHAENGVATDPPLDLTLPLQKSNPGTLSLHLRQYGAPDETKLGLTAYTAGIKLTALHLRPGDKSAVLTGSGLTDVKSVDVAGTTYNPGDGSNANTVALEGQKPFDGKDKIIAHATLQDGRTMDVPVTVDAARPALKLVSKSFEPTAGNTLAIALSNQDALPVATRITLAVQAGDTFPRDEKIEVATADNSAHTTLSLSDGSMILQDAQTALAFLAPLKAFGPSAFGPARMRAIAADGTAGDWMPIGILVREPTLSALACTGTKCTLTGSNLYLIDSIAASEDFTTPVKVATGFAGPSLPVPQPQEGQTLYLKLRDDPTHVVTVKMGTAAH